MRTALPNKPTWMEAGMNFNRTILEQHPTSIEGLELGRKNTIVVGENMQTNLPTIFAGGDIVRGGATVILAMGDGRRAAQSMHEFLSK